ncbi:hypothetical protein LCGC14_2874790, partial [marine sediment metagenome]
MDALNSSGGGHFLDGMFDLVEKGPMEKTILTNYDALLQRAVT